MHRFWDSGNSLVTVETDLEGMYRVIARMSKNKNEKMSSEILKKDEKKIFLMLHVIFLSVTLVTNWQTVGLIYVTAAYSYTEVKETIYSEKKICNLR